MHIERVHFDMGTGVITQDEITQREFNDIMGAYAVNDIPVTTRWVEWPEECGSSLVTVTVRGRIHYAFVITQ